VLTRAADADRAAHREAFLNKEPKILGVPTLRYSRQGIDCRHPQPPPAARVKPIALVRRREVWLPTLWGWLAILALLALLSGLIARNIGAWLAVNDPLAAGPAPRVLVIEGWLPERELDDAAAYARTQGYARIIATGGPIESFSPFASYAERAAQHLRQRLPGLPVDAVSAPATAQDRTFASAVWLRDWAARERVALDAFDLYSLGAHARRTRMVYRIAFGDGVRVGIVAGMPKRSDPRRWWTSSDAAKTVWLESASVAWTWCCFRPPPRGSHEERWAVPPQPQ
jgi:hypothetical protein